MIDWLKKDFARIMKKAAKKTRTDALKKKVRRYLYRRAKTAVTIRKPKALRQRYRISNKPKPKPKRR